MSDPQVISVRPERDQYAWTFGSAPPVARIRPPAVLEDAFFGNVRSENDLVSEVCEFPYANPQTGPFDIEGPATPWRSISSRSSRPGTGARRPRSPFSAR